MIIPNNFELKKYDAFFQLSASLWRSEIKRRHMVFLAQNIQPDAPMWKDFEGVYGFQGERTVAGLVDWLIESPIVSEHFPDSSLFDAYDLLADTAYSESLPEAIHDYTVKDFSAKLIELSTFPEIAGMMRNEVNSSYHRAKEIVDLFGGKDDDTFSIRAKASQALHEALAGISSGKAQQNYQDAFLGDGLVRIDLNLPDSLLQQEFKQWLKNQRSAVQKKKGNYYQETLRVWGEKRVMAYVDLQFLARQEGLRGLGWKQVANLLFSDLADCPELGSVRKTLDKHYQFITNWQRSFDFIAEAIAAERTH